MAIVPIILFIAFGLIFISLMVVVDLKNKPTGDDQQ